MTIKRLNNTSADELKSSIKCAISNNTPFSREVLLASLEHERNAAARSTVIKLLEAEILRQKNSLGLYTSINHIDMPEALETNNDVSN